MLVEPLDGLWARLQGSRMANEGQAVPPDRRRRLPPCHAHDAVTGTCERNGEDGADGTRAEDGDRGASSGNWFIHRRASLTDDQVDPSSWRRVRGLAL
jgi:hypothetical protein